MKIALGTVQFGMDYGVSNTTGQTTKDEIWQILATAVKSGVDIIDTASLYGTSEDVLGCYMPKGYGKLVTKTPQFSSSELTEIDGDNLSNSFQQSLAKLKRKNVYGLLVHNADDLLKPGGLHLYNALENLKAQGVVNKIGVSVYTGVQIDAILEQFPIDLIQLPVNIFDQRLIQNGQLQRLNDRGVEVHARSIFLQGLLLMEPEALPVCFNCFKPQVSTYHSFLKKIGMSPVQAALGFVVSLKEVSHVVCGVNNDVQWRELIAASSISLDVKQFTQFAVQDLSILDPSRWKVS